MSTIIYPSPIFGPIHSRRLGVSLGINLMPGDGKVCTFDCIYCECGFNKDFRPKQRRPSREEVKTALHLQLQKMKNEGPSPDVLTFAGNGEPTLHPDFPAIIEDTMTLRDQFFPQAKVSVLTNATLIKRPSVFEALKKVDNNILKLDTVNIDYIQQVNRPTMAYSVEEQIQLMVQFKGHAIIQTMFMKAQLNGREVDNTEESYVAPWLDAIKAIRPQSVMIYTIDRETPDKTLRKVSPEVLDRIVERIQALGFPATASY